MLLYGGVLRVMRRCRRGKGNYACIAAVAFALGILFALCGSIRLIVFMSAALIIWIALSVK